jgi:hypothetical protein
MNWLQIKLRIVISIFFILGSYNSLAFDPYEGSGLPADKASAYIESLGYTTNEPQELPDGSYAIFLTGMMPIAVAPDHPNFIAERTVSFDAAVINAKSEFAKFLGSRIRGEMTLEIKRGKFPSPEEIQNASSGTSAVDFYQKAKLLLMSELDKQLKENNVDIYSMQDQAADNQKALDEATARAEKLLNERKFSQAIEQTANRMVSGVQILGVWEDFTPGETKGTMAIAAVYSDKTLKLAQAILNKDPSLSPESDFLNPGMSIKETVKDFGAGLLTFQGTKLIKNEKGEPVLLSFGHSFLQMETTEEKMIAERDASLKADGYLGSFAGEMVSAFESLNGSSTYSQLTDGEHLERSGGYQSAENLKFNLELSGVKKVVSWLQEHPLSGQKIVGVVKSWSPTSAMLADKAEKGELSKKEEISSSDDNTLLESDTIEEGYSSEGTSSNLDF